MHNGLGHMLMYSCMQNFETGIILPTICTCTALKSHDVSDQWQNRIRKLNEIYLS